MELIFLLLLIILMAISLGSGFPVAFALPGSAIISIGVAAFFGYFLENNADAYFFLVDHLNGCQLVLLTLEEYIGRLKEIP